MSKSTQKELSKSSELFFSVIIAAITALFVSSSIGPAIVQPLLLDGSLISNGRFAFVYDAYDTIEDDDVPSIVGIGSSILMEGMNGTCMQEQSSIENARFYNMAMSGGKPYSEMLQIPALIESKPDVVMIEIGPNSLYGWDSTQYVNGITDYNEFRFQLMSMGMETNQIGDWYDVLDPVDRQWIETNRLGRIDAWSEYTRDAVEEYLTREIDDLTNALDEESYTYVPPVGTDEWDNYLSGPNWRTSKFDAKSLTEIREYLDEKMPSKSKQGVYNPKANNTQNHKALDYMIKSLVNASIDVVLVGIPHHPWVNEYLEPEQLDGMNLTYQRYQSLQGVYPLQMYFEEWPSDAFSDRNHLDADGREVFCKRVTPVIDAVYSGQDPSLVEVLPSMFETNNNLRHCEGSGKEFIFTSESLQFEAEDYSTCELGKTGIESVWEFETRLVDFSGDGYIAALPDGKHYLGDTINGPHVGYNISFPNPGLYDISIRMQASDSQGDSIHVGLNGEALTLGGYGFSTGNNSEWNWELIEVNVTSNGSNQLDIWMREDGVAIDTIMISQKLENSPELEQESPQVVECLGSNIQFVVENNYSFIEAEQYSFCRFGQNGIASLWNISTNLSNFSGTGYMIALPDGKHYLGDSTNGPHLVYNLTTEHIGIHHIWIRMSASDSQGDSIHVGLNGEALTLGGYGFSTENNSVWNWELIEVNVTSNGSNQLDIWMREDGVMVDSLIITTDSNFIPN